MESLSPELRGPSTLPVDGLCEPHIAPHHSPQSLPEHMLLLLQAGVLGALGLAAGLLLETALLIIRANMPVPLDQKYTHLLDKKWDTWQEKHGQQDAAGGSSCSSRAAGASKTQLRKLGGGNSRLEHAAHSKKE